jgi:hypothetical protein
VLLTEGTWPWDAHAEAETETETETEGRAEPEDPELLALPTFMCVGDDW